MSYRRRPGLTRQRCEQPVQASHPGWNLVPKGHLVAGYLRPRCQTGTEGEAWVDIDEATATYFADATGRVCGRPRGIE